MTLFEDAASCEEEEGWLCRSTGQAATEPLLHLQGGGQHAREGRTAGGARAAFGRAESLMGTPQPQRGYGRAGGQESRARSTHRPARLLAWHTVGEQGVLTNVGVLQEAADPGFSFQLLVI